MPQPPGAPDPGPGEQPRNLNPRYISCKRPPKTDGPEATLWGGPEWKRRKCQPLAAAAAKLWRFCGGFVPPCTPRVMPAVWRPNSRLAATRRHRCDGGCRRPSPPDRYRSSADRRAVSEATSVAARSVDATVTRTLVRVPARLGCSAWPPWRRTFRLCRGRFRRGTHPGHAMRHVAGPQPTASTSGAPPPIAALGR